MPARAMWKARVKIGERRIPVKLYSAIEDRSVHFRLLHAKDHAPVRQALVDPETDEVVPFEEARRGFVTGEGTVVRLDPEEIAAVQPEPSRDIVVERVLPAHVLDHRWYDRPYYLGPDGSAGAYAALARALERSGREGVATWTMRNKAYQGVLRLHRGYPVLITLRHEDEVIDQDELEAPKGAEPDEREFAMARQLVGMLAGAFEPEAYRDSYRDRVLELIAAKRRGARVETPPAPPRRAPRDLTRALQASLEGARARA